MRIKNTTNIPAEIVREVIRFTRPPGISNFDVMLRNSTGAYVAGRAYTQGSGYHSRAVPFIVARVPTETLPRWTITRVIDGKPRKFFTTSRPWADSKEKWVRTNMATYPLTLHPYQRGHLRGKKYWIANRTEHLVYIIAHELRHLWQAKGSERRRGMAHGARGRFSEIDTESYAIRMVRAWRRHMATIAPQLPPPADPAPDQAAKRAVAARARLLASIAKNTASLKRWNTKAKRAKTAITKLNRTLKRLMKKAGNENS